MAQCMAHVYYLDRHVKSHCISRSIHGLTGSPFFPRTMVEDMMNVDGATMDNPSKLIVCFRDDDTPEFVDKELKDYGVRTNLHIRYSPWAIDMINGLGSCEGKKIKESTGGPVGGGRGGDDSGDDGDGGESDDDGDEYVYLLPVLTLAFAAFHLGYCIAVWVRDENLDLGFFRTGLGLFGLLALAAIRLNSGAGLDAYILGLGASLGVMAWTGERCLVKKEGSPAGVVALFAATMAVMFTAALYHNI